MSDEHPHKPALLFMSFGIRSMSCPRLIHPIQIVLLSSMALILLTSTSKERNHVTHWSLSFRYKIINSCRITPPRLPQDHHHARDGRHLHGQAEPAQQPVEEGDPRAYQPALGLRQRGARRNRADI